MKKPYIICHMMTSIDGRIECEMTGQLAGVDDYYTALNELNAPTSISGRVTAELELALPGKFEGAKETIKQKCFSKKTDAASYEIICDSNGTLLWPKTDDTEKPYLILMSERASKEYLAYLDEQNISYIVCGQDKIDLIAAMEILATNFHVERAAVVGGPTINTAFLEAGLLDEISLFIGSGIDARASKATIFDGLAESHPIVHLNLMDVTKYDSGTVWIRYTLK